MATRGFEFAFDLNQASTPMIRTLTCGDGTAYAKGDLVTIQSDGYADKQTASIGEITGVVEETVASPSAGTTTMRVALATPSQVWRCSMDAATSTGVVGYTKTLDVADQNTIDADDISNGSLILFDKSELDDDGNVLAYVMFSNVTFGILDTDTT